MNLKDKTEMSATLSEPNGGILSESARQSPDEKGQQRHRDLATHIRRAEDERLCTDIEKSSSRRLARQESDEYTNLNELVGPAPVENPRERTLNLEDIRSEKRQSPRYSNEGNSDTELVNRSETSNYENLNELVGPPLAENPNEPVLYRHQSLEEIQLEENSRHREDSTRRQRTHSQNSQGSKNYLTELYIMSYLILFSILGTLARLGIQAMPKYPGCPAVPTELWANVGGSFFMGYLSEDRLLFRNEWDSAWNDAQRDHNYRGGYQEDTSSGSDVESMLAAAKKSHNSTKKTIPVYIGLAVGFCGSLTSFSSFIRDAFLALANLNNSMATEVPRNPGYSVMAVLGVIFIEISLCLSALMVGAHGAILCHPLSHRIPAMKARRVLDPAAVVLGWGCWIAAIIMAIWPPDRPFGPAANGNTTWTQETWRGQVLFALVFAPLGCLIRFHASLHLNDIFAQFPLGTFLVNIVGTLILGVCWDLQRVGSIGGGQVVCQVLQGVQDGFCGCLTTVSAWVMELNGLRRRHAYMYAIASVSMGLALLVVIMGSLIWTLGASTPSCAL